MSGPARGFSLSLLPGLSLNHKRPTKRSYFSLPEYRWPLNSCPTPRKPERTMSKKSRNDKKSKSTLDSDTKHSGVNGQPKIGKSEYEAEILELPFELVKLQDWVKATNARIVIIFEGRDAAGKGGMIKRLMERVSPRIFRVVALPHQPRGRRRSSMLSASLKISRPEVKSSSSTGAGITAPLLST